MVDPAVGVVVSGVVEISKLWLQYWFAASRQAGLSEEQISRFHSPIGLELHAETPEEIAVSILAEVIMLHRGGTGDRMAVVPKQNAV